MSCTSLTAAWVEIFVFSLDLFVPALFETFEFSSRGKNFSAPWSKTLCAITLWLWVLFSSRTLPETMIAIEASEAKFLFGYVFCSLSSILFLESSTVPQCVTTLTQNARRRFRLILSLTSYLAFGCKNFGCFWFNWFLVFCLRIEYT